VSTGVPSPIALKPRLMSCNGLTQKVITTYSDPVTELYMLYDFDCQDAMSDVVVACVWPKRGTAMTCIAPAAAAAVAWFVATYGPQLTKAALDYGIRKIEAKLK
jgi:hypothetical protein